MIVSRFRPNRLELVRQWMLLSLAALLTWGQPAFAQTAANLPTEPQTVDFRYAPAWWQTSICFPDDWQKTLVGKDGSLLYDFPGAWDGFATKIMFGLDRPTDWLRQDLASPRVPIVRTLQRAGGLDLQTEVFALAPPQPAKVKNPAETEKVEATPKPTGPPRYDLLVARVQATGKTAEKFVPAVTIQSRFPIAADAARQRVSIGQTTLFFPQPFERTDTSSNKWVLKFKEQSLAGGAQTVFALGVARGEGAAAALPNLAGAERYRARAERYWQNLNLPYGHIEIPDAGVQALLDSSIRNIYQAREIKGGLPAFQVGPTCYRGLWVVDGSFLMEAVAYLGRIAEARDGLKYLLSFQRDDGGFMLINGHWKETGIVLWAVTRHARLTGDRAWLREVWPKLEKGVAYIHQLRVMASPDPKALNAGLVPAGFSDGGLGESRPEYTNVYWTMVGLHAAIEAARWLDNPAEAEDWQREYNDFMNTFDRAMARDMRTDSLGNRYLPIRMGENAGIAPQRAQWAFLHAVFPGKVFAPDDPPVPGNMAMLEAVEKEGLVFGTGWLAEGLWNYFGSFYAHAWLWLGRGDKAAQALYGFANHASPLLCWREEQMPVGKGPQICGDMPHNWASAEFIRLVRHSLVLERDQELHLCEALPASWIRPNGLIRLRNIETDFGPLSMELQMAADGKTARLRLNPPRRTSPTRIVLHLDYWTAGNGVLPLSTTEKVDQIINLRSN